MVNLELQGLQELMRKLRPPEDLYAKPWRDAMEEQVKLGAKGARQTAPRGKSGALLAGLSYKVQRSPVPKWAVLKNTTLRKGVSYPAILERSPKHHHFGWMRRAMDQAMGQADRVLSKAARQIERRWGR